MRNSALLAALLLASCGSENPPPAISIDSAWARATAPGQSATAVYFKMANSGGSDRLVSVSSSFGQASLHSTSTGGGVMRMRQLDSLDIPANATVELKPGATHVMITGLSHDLAEGQQLPLDLTFERSGKRAVVAAVRAGEPQ